MAIGQLIVILLHVMLESMVTILDEVSNTINFIKNKFKDRQFMVAIGMDANLTLPRGSNGESGPITGGWIMGLKLSHKRKDVNLLMAFLDGHGMRVQSSMSPLRPGVSCPDEMDHCGCTRGEEKEETKPNKHQRLSVHKLITFQLPKG